MKAIRTLFVVVGGCAVAGVTVGALVSSWYWGFAFTRPEIPEVAGATSVSSVTSLRAAAQGQGCTVEAEEIRDLRAEVEARGRYVDEFPDLRAVVALNDRGLLPASAQPPIWFEPSKVYGAVEQAGVLVDGDPGYDTRGWGCFGGYLIELSLPGGESRVLLTAGGPEVSNDHHPYYELVFRREGDGLVLERKRVSYYDIAGIEGFEWPLMHTFFVVVCLAIATASALVLAIAKALARWVARRRAAAAGA